MKHAAREHPFILFIVLMTLSPLILGACLLFIVAYTVGVAVDMLAGRP